MTRDTDDTVPGRPAYDANSDAAPLVPPLSSVFSAEPWRRHRWQENGYRRAKRARARRESA